MMDVKIRENLSRNVRKKTGYDEDREMEECLARLRVWQNENLMAPHGMDRFAESSGKAKNRKIIKGGVPMERNL